MPARVLLAAICTGARPPNQPLQGGDGSPLPKDYQHGSDGAIPSPRYTWGAGTLLGVEEPRPPSSPSAGWIIASSVRSGDPGTGRLSDRLEGSGSRSGVEPGAVPRAPQPGCPRGLRAWQAGSAGRCMSGTCPGESEGLSPPPDCPHLSSWPPIAARPAGPQDRVPFLLWFEPEIG